MPSQSARRRIYIDGKSVQPASKRRPRKSIFAIALAPIIAVIAIATGIASASACHPLIQAGADCNGQVTFTATAWNDSDATDDSRTNNNVDIQYSINGVDGPFVPVSTGTKQEFNKDNNFSFSGKFDLPSNLKRPSSVTIRAVALAKWGPSEDIDTANQSNSTTIRVPGDCAVPTVKITGPSCTSSNAIIALTNSSTEAVTFGLYKDGSSEPFATQTVSNGTKNTTVVVKSPTTVTVKVKGSEKVLATQKLQVPTDCVQVNSAVTKVCKADGSGWTVTFDNSDSKIAETFVVKSGERTLDSVEVAAGKKQTASYSFADAGLASGSSMPLTVVVNDRVIATETVTNDCVNSTADVAAVCDTPAGSGAVLTFTNTGQVAETFNVVRDGRAVDGSPFTLEPSSETTKKLLRLNEDASAVISITSTSGINVQKQVTLDCAAAAPKTPTAAEVKGETVTRGRLADTGAPIVPFAIIGGLLLFTGAGLLGIRRTF